MDALRSGYSCHLGKGWRREALLRDHRGRIDAKLKQACASDYGVLQLYLRVQGEGGSAPANAHRSSSAMVSSGREGQSTLLPLWRTSRMLGVLAETCLGGGIANKEPP